MGGFMDDDICSGNGGVSDRRVGSVPDHQVRRRRDVVKAPRGQIVEHSDAVPLIQQTLGHV